jgi:hypothetical protein
MKKLFLFLIFSLLLQPPESPAAKIFGFGSKDYDVVLVASPVSIREVRPRESFDAIEETQEPPQHIVSFKIERTLVGELAKEKRGGPSRIDQAREAAKKKEYLKLASLNFEDPDIEVEKEWFRIAVKNSGETFGVTPGGSIPGHRFKLYLKQVPKMPKTYFLVKRELLD